MADKKSKATRIPPAFHPFLFALYPVLFLYAQNADLLLWTELIAPLGVMLALVVILWFGLGLLVKDHTKLALLISTAWLLFFSFRHIQKMVYTLTPASVMIGRGRYLLPLIGVLFLLLAFRVLRSRRELRKTTTFLNTVAVLLLAISTVQIGYAYLIRTEAKPLDNLPLATDLTLEEMPDIYYIVLDSYAGNNILKEMYHYDNSGFLGELKKRGFFVAEESRSNYCQTHLSLASSMNLTYLDSLTAEFGVESGDRSALFDMIRNSTVASSLRRLGYRFIVFASGCSVTDWAAADVYVRSGLSIGQLSNALVNVTPLHGLLRLVARTLAGSQYEWHRRWLLYTFEHLADFSGSDQPVFVLAHAMSLHPPFVFDEKGQPVNPERPFTFNDADDFIKEGGTENEYLSGYRRQLAFVNQKILATVDDILSKSTRPAVVILQADHGSRIRLDWKDITKTYLPEAFSILNAYHLPTESNPGLYESISPVNSFRVVFNCYFGTGLEYLPDRSYYSTWGRPYDFVDVTDNVSSRRAKEAVPRKDALDQANTE